MTALHDTRTRFRPTVAIVDLAAIRRNVKRLKPDRAELMAVVKANGYGHGAVPVARVALEAGATWLGVALVEEGLELRESGIDAPILVLTEFPPGSERAALDAGLTPSLYTPVGLERLAAAARPAGLRPKVHVKVDTGMHRVGMAPEGVASFVDALVDAGLELEALWTHFAKSEEVSDPFTATQLDGFLAVAGAIRSEAAVAPKLHAANSGAVMGHPASHLDMVRVGVALYGQPPGPRVPGVEHLIPAMSWVSEVALVKRIGAGEGVSYGLRYRASRDANLATVPVGYADGYPRVLSNRGPVLIRGRRYRVAGTVTMDQLLVDCGDDPVAPGDAVTLIGRQGDEEITAAELAGLAGTIPYEIVCGVGPRVPREYSGA